VNDRHLDFGDIIQSVLYGNFTMPLPPTFQKIDPDTSTSKRSGGNIDSKEAKGKKQKSTKGTENKEKAVLVKNTSQHESFKMKEGEGWKKTFKTAHVHDRPTWDGVNSTKMCIRWHVLGECFDNCDRSESHVPKDAIPAEKVTEMCTFIAKCRKGE
jgi:hypothetical protein